MVLADEPTGALDSKSARQLLETFEHLNQNLGATILMVTHDAFTASYADRIIFIKDGKVFSELVKGEDTRKQFFEKIIEVQTLLGGGKNTNIKNYINRNHISRNYFFNCWYFYRCIWFSIYVYTSG